MTEHLSTSLNMVYLSSCHDSPWNRSYSNMLTKYYQSLPQYRIFLDSIADLSDEELLKHYQSYLGMFACYPDLTCTFQIETIEALMKERGLSFNLRWDRSIGQWVEPWVYQDNSSPTNSSLSKPAQGCLELFRALSPLPYTTPSYLSRNALETRWEVATHQCAFSPLCSKPINHSLMHDFRVNKFHMRSLYHYHHLQKPHI